jgi:hypothetical protein
VCRSAIGARVTVEANGHRQVQEAMSGGSYYSQSDVALDFGLGPAEAIDRVEARWPSGKIQSCGNLAGGRKYTITEGKSDAESKPFLARTKLK